MSPRSPFDRISVLIVSALLFLTPLAHSGTLSDPFGLPKSILVLCGALLLLLAAILDALRGVPRPRMRSAALGLIAAFVLAASLATALSSNRGIALRGLVEIAGMAVVAWAAARSTRDPGDAAWMMRSALAGASLVAAGSVLQVFRPGFSIAIGELSLLPPAPAGASLGDPGLAAQLLLVALPMGIGAAGLSSGATRLLCGAALGVLLAALLLASRPEGWIVGAGVLLLLATTRAIQAARSTEGLVGLLPDPSGGTSRATIVATAVLLVVLALSHAPGIASAEHPVAPLDSVSLLAPTTGNPASDRAAAARGSGALLLVHPLGVGPSYWRHAFLEVAWSRVAASPFDLGHQAIHAGNSILELAAETGIAGGLIFAALCFLLVVQAGRAAFLDPGPWGTVAYAGLNTLLAAGLAAFFGSPFQETATVLLVWVTAGVTQAAAVKASLPGITGRFAREVPPGEPGRSPRRLLAWVALALWIPLAVGSALWVSSRLEAARRTLAAQGSMSSGDLRRVIETLDVSPMRRSPDHLPFALLADAFLRSGAWDRSVEAFTATLDRSPWYPAAYLGRATAWEAQGRYDRAEADLLAALRIWPDAPEILLRRARLDARRGRIDAALEGYRNLARVSPKMPDPWCGMGDLYLGLGRVDAAMEAYGACGSRNPGFPGVNLGMAESYERRGMYEMALNYYQRAAGADDKNVAIRLRIANLYDQMGQFCSAKDSLMAARDLESDTSRRGLILDLIDTIDPKCRGEQRASP
jgi:tetratricopeptide (TPR) repeat protein